MSILEDLFSSILHLVSALGFQRTFRLKTMWCVGLEIRYQMLARGSCSLA